MSKERFSTLLFITVSDLVKRLAAGAENARETIKSFYRSKVYAVLSDRDSGLWHSSTDMLLELYHEELKTGKINCNWCL